jgi:hypothetical protein
MALPIFWHLLSRSSYLSLVRHWLFFFCFFDSFFFCVWSRRYYQRVFVFVCVFRLIIFRSVDRKWCAFISSIQLWMSSVTTLMSGQFSMFFDCCYTIPFSFLFYLNNVIVYLTRYNIILPGETSDIVGCKIINRKGQSATFKGASNSECGRNASGRQKKKNS